MHLTLFPNKNIYCLDILGNSLKHFKCKTIQKLIYLYDFEQDKEINDFMICIFVLENFLKKLKEVNSELLNKLIPGFRLTIFFLYLTLSIYILL